MFFESFVSVFILIHICIWALTLLLSDKILDFLLVGVNMFNMFPDSNNPCTVNITTIICQLELIVPSLQQTGQSRLYSYYAAFCRTARAAPYGRLKHSPAQSIIMGLMVMLTGAQWCVRSVVARAGASTLCFGSSCTPASTSDCFLAANMTLADLESFVTGPAIFKW